MIFLAHLFHTDATFFSNARLKAIRKSKSFLVDIFFFVFFLMDVSSLRWHLYDLALNRAPADAPPAEAPPADAPPADATPAEA